MTAEQRLAELGLTLPPEPRLPIGLEVPFEWVHVDGSLAHVSGHGAQNSDGSIAPPLGMVPIEVPLPLAQESARKAALSMLGSLQRTLGSLDRIEQWLTIDGFVNARPGYEFTTAVLNPFSELILDVFGAAGAHARTAMGVTATPMNLPVVAKATVRISA